MAANKRGVRLNRWYWGPPSFVLALAGSVLTASQIGYAQDVTGPSRAAEAAIPAIPTKWKNPRTGNLYTVRIAGESVFVERLLDRADAMLGAYDRSELRRDGAVYRGTSRIGAVVLNSRGDSRSCEIEKENIFELRVLSATLIEGTFQNFSVGASAPSSACTFTPTGSPVLFTWIPALPEEQPVPQAARDQLERRSQDDAETRARCDRLAKHLIAECGTSITVSERVYCQELQNAYRYACR